MTPIPRWAALVGALLAGATVIAIAPPAPAAPRPECPPASVGGPAVGHITVGAQRVPIKEVDFAAGEAFEPPATNRAAGLSARHAGLDAQRGTTVIGWHVRYHRGCPGALNALLKSPIGTVFTVQSVTGSSRSYRITDRFTVPKGRYQAAWFDQAGPHRLALFSCATLRRGEFRDTAVVFAEPAAP